MTRRHGLAYVVVLAVAALAGGLLVVLTQHICNYHMARKAELTRALVRQALGSAEAYLNTRSAGSAELRAGEHIELPPDVFTEAGATGEITITVSSDPSCAELAAEIHARCRLSRARATGRRYVQLRTPASMPSDNGRS